MRRIGLAVVLALSLLLAPLAAEAQPAGRVWRIGFLANSWQAQGSQFVVHTACDSAPGENDGSPHAVVLRTPD